MRRRVRISLRFRLLCLLLALAVVFVWLDTRLTPLIKQYAASAVEMDATQFINEAVTAVLSEQTDLYGQLVTVTESPGGEVCSVRANIGGINLLKSSITTELIRRAERLPFRDISVPIGTVIGGSLLTGRGPGIPIRVSVAGSVLSTLFSEFSAAGINQTDHRLYLSITVRFFVALPTYTHTSVEVTASFLVAETVLVGSVPDSYTAVNDDRSDLIGKIFDYADIGL